MGVGECLPAGNEGKGDGVRRVGGGLGVGDRQRNLQVNAQGFVKNDPLQQS